MYTYTTLQLPYQRRLPSSGAQPLCKCILVCSTAQEVFLKRVGTVHHVFVMHCLQSVLPSTVHNTTLSCTAPPCWSSTWEQDGIALMTGSNLQQHRDLHCIIVMQFDHTLRAAWSPLQPKAQQALWDRSLPSMAAHSSLASVHTCSALLLE